MLSSGLDRNRRRDWAASVVGRRRGYDGARTVDFSHWCNKYCNHNYKQPRHFLDVHLFLLGSNLGLGPCEKVDTSGGRALPHLTLLTIRSKTGIRLVVSKAARGQTSRARERILPPDQRRSQTAAAPHRSKLRRSALARGYEVGTASEVTYGVPSHRGYPIDSGKTDNFMIDTNPAELSGPNAAAR